VASSVANPGELTSRTQRGAQPPKRVRTRLALLRAAAELLGQEDGRVFRVEDVVSKVGMTRATFYNHFESRKDFFELIAFELTHHFNTVLLPAVYQESDIARRAAMAGRYYLNKADTDRKWGWAVVNVSLNSPKLFGEETFAEATKTISMGQADGTFKLKDLGAGRDMYLGAMLAAFLHILHGTPSPIYISTITMVLLRGLGVPTAKAERLASEPLPELPPYAAPFCAPAPSPMEPQDTHQDKPPSRRKAQRR